MKARLDTHTFICWDSEPTRLSPLVLRSCNDPETTILLSVASVWEMQIKLQLGKLTLTMPLADIIRGQQQMKGIEVLPVTLAHVLASYSLPTPHKDPFDRLLVAQANVEDVVLLSADSIFAQYPVKVLW